MTSIVAWDFTTFLTVLSFSAFTYYIAKLNLEVERLNHVDEIHRADAFFPAIDLEQDKNQNSSNLRKSSSMR